MLICELSSYLSSQLLFLFKNLSAFPAIPFPRWNRLQSTTVEMTHVNSAFISY